MTRFDEASKRRIHGMDSIFQITTDMFREEIMCDNQTLCHQRLLPCERRKRSSTLKPKFKDIPVRVVLGIQFMSERKNQLQGSWSLSPTSITNYQVEEGDVVYRCCQCYPGRKRWDCEPNGRRKSMQTARIDFENGFNVHCGK